MAYIQQSDYPFVNMNGFLFEDDAANGKLSIKPLLSIADSIGRFKVARLGTRNPYTYSVGEDTKLRGGFPKTLLADGFEAGRPFNAGLLPGYVFTELPPSGEDFNLADYPDPGPYETTEFGRCFPSLVKQTWKTHPYSFGATYDSQEGGATFGIRCFNKQQPLWEAPIEAMAGDIEDSLFFYLPLPLTKPIDESKDEGFYDAEGNPLTYMLKKYWKGYGTSDGQGGYGWQVENSFVGVAASYNGEWDWSQWEVPLVVYGGAIVRRTELFGLGTVGWIWNLYRDWTEIVQGNVVKRESASMHFSTASFIFGQTTSCFDTMVDICGSHLDTSPIVPPHASAEWVGLPYEEEIDIAIGPNGNEGMVGTRSNW